jgi:protease-4
MYNLGSLFSGPDGTLIDGSGPRMSEVVRENNHASDKIVIIDVAGIIMSGAGESGAFDMVDVIRAQLKHAAKDRDVKAVILKVDSPGGEVLASDEIYRAILDFQTKTSKPVVASMGSVAASGGYYVSAPCQWIVANELTITGSIGVIMSSYNYRGLMDKVGLKPQVYKSGKYKDMLSGSRNPEDVTTEERDMINNLIMETYGRFKEVVAEGRSGAARRNDGKGKKLADNWADFADGRVFTGKEALQRGFVDELGNFQVAVERAKTIANLKNANLVVYQQHLDFADLFKLFGKSQARVKIDVGLDVPKLPAGRLYFLAPTFVN